MANSIWYARAAIAVLLASSYFIARVISPSIAWENGPLEILESVFLLAGLLVAVRMAVTSADQAGRGFWAVTAVIWLTMLGRELSWGAVLISDPVQYDYGPGYTSHDLWYKPAVYPIICLLAIASMLAAWRWGSWTVMRRLFDRHRLPWTSLGLAAIGFAISLVAEGHAGVTTGLPVLISQNWEETAEFSAYLALLVAQAEVILALA